MRFGKLMGKNVFLSMILCSVASFSLLHADNLKECESEEDKQAGCVEKVYDDSGNLKIETPFKNGKEEGVEKAYYENGNLKVESLAKNGKEEGIQKWYYEGGNLMFETPYKNGKREGMGKRYYESGKLEIEAPFKNHMLEGIMKRYYESGDIQVEIQYANDEINGIVKFYNKEKELIWQATAQNGNLTSGKCSSGKALTSAHLTRLANEISQNITGGDYWYDICKQ